MSDDRPPDSHDTDHDGDDVRAATDRERTSDAVDRTERSGTATADRGDAQAGEPSDDQRGGSDPDPAASTGADDGGGSARSDRLAFWFSALFGLALAVGAIALVSGRAPFFEELLRVRPTVGGGGIGADWLVGNTEPILEAAITLVHLADVVMGIFILLMVFIHWAAFRRLATRMRPPAGSARQQETTAATDGGRPDSDPPDEANPDSSPLSGSSGGSHDETTRSSGGEANDVSRSTSDHKSDGGEANDVSRSTSEHGSDGGESP